LPLPPPPPSKIAKFVKCPVVPHNKLDDVELLLRQGSCHRSNTKRGERERERPRPRSMSIRTSQVHAPQRETRMTNRASERERAPAPRIAMMCFHRHSSGCIPDIDSSCSSMSTRDTLVSDSMVASTVPIPIPIPITITIPITIIVVAISIIESNRIESSPNTCPVP